MRGREAQGCRLEGNGRGREEERGGGRESGMTGDSARGVDVVLMRQRREGRKMREERRMKGGREGCSHSQTAATCQELM